MASYIKKVIGLRETGEVMLGAEVKSVVVPYEHWSAHFDEEDVPHILEGLRFLRWRGSTKDAPTHDPFNGDSRALRSVCDGLKKALTAYQYRGRVSSAIIIRRPEETVAVLEQAFDFERVEETGPVIPAPKRIIQPPEVADEAVPA
jgi:hypothetical protein